MIDPTAKNGQIPRSLQPNSFVTIAASSRRRHPHPAGKRLEPHTSQAVRHPTSPALRARLIPERVGAISSCHRGRSRGIPETAGLL